MIEVVRSQIGVITYLVPTGPFEDQEALNVLNATAEECLTERALQLVIDMTKVPHLSSLGLEALLDIHDRLTRVGGNLKVVHLNNLLKDIFLVTGISDYIEVIEEE